MSACLILDVTDADQWLPGPGKHGHVGAVLVPTTRRLPECKRPTIVHDSRAIAEVEAMRLAEAHPDRRFAIFETSLVACAAAVPTHITLGGQIIARRYVAALATVDEDVGIPF